MFTLIQRRNFPLAPRPSLLARLIFMDSAFRQRRAMARLTDAQLRDAGLTRADVQATAQQPLWDCPPHWRA